MLLVLAATDRLMQATATTAQVLMKCMHCSSETARSSSSFVNDLVYPQMVSGQQSNPRPLPRSISDLVVPDQNYVRGRPPTATSFSDILKKSIEREQTARGWCTTCRGYQPLATRKTIKSIPQVLAANANISTAEQKRLWATPGWLPEEIGIIIGDEHLYCFEGEDLKLHLQRAKHEIYVYSLIGVVVNIDRGPPHKPHLISMVNGASRILLACHVLVAQHQSPPFVVWCLRFQMSPSPPSSRRCRR